MRSWKREKDICREEENKEYRRDQECGSMAETIKQYFCWIHKNTGMKKDNTRTEMKKESLYFFKKEHSVSLHQISQETETASERGFFFLNNHINQKNLGKVPAKKSTVFNYI